MAGNGPTTGELVNVIIDGKPISVPKGTNLIDAAKMAGADVPYYCYHPHLSVAGNCRMCQVQVKGAPKLDIACNTQVREGMEVSTQNTSKAVEDAQAATLEFILINHPLDCTVCDQAGHCKLQDYHYEYNARPSRFLEEKEHKVKAEPLGPHVILDGERCIMCTRCIRFCDEVTETSELGMLNRGDRSVIAINKGRELANPLSGTVVDLCPVGALTHRDWRFNTRIWFTKETESICPGCSTGCNVKVAERDGKIVQVKARLNSQVNKEWLCDEGRYGFSRFLPDKRLRNFYVGGREVSKVEALKEAKRLASQPTLVLVSPDLLLEDYAIIKVFIEKALKNSKVVLAYKERQLSKTEQKLISPDYAANFRAAEFAGLVSGDLASQYQTAISDLASGNVKSVLFIGDRAVFVEDRQKVTQGLSKSEISVGIFSDIDSELAKITKVLLPGRSVLEKSGLMINRASRLQYSDKVIDFPDGTESDWKLVANISAECGAKITGAVSDRDRTIEYIGAEAKLKGLKILNIKMGGVCLKTYAPGQGQVSQEAGEARP